MSLDLDGPFEIVSGNFLKGLLVFVKEVGNAVFSLILVLVDQSDLFLHVSMLVSGFGTDVGLLLCKGGSWGRPLPIRLARTS